MIKDNGCACATRSCSRHGHVGPLLGSSPPPPRCPLLIVVPSLFWPCPAAARIYSIRRPNIAPVSAWPAREQQPFENRHVVPVLISTRSPMRSEDLVAAREVRAREKDYAPTIRRRKHSVAPAPRFCAPCDPCVTGPRRQAFESAPRIVGSIPAAPLRKCVAAMTPKMPAASSLLNKIEVRYGAIRLTLWSVGVFVARQKHVAVAENSRAECDGGGAPNRHGVVSPSCDKKPVARGRFGSRARSQSDFSMFLPSHAARMRRRASV